MIERYTPARDGAGSGAEDAKYAAWLRVELAVCEVYARARASSPPTRSAASDRRRRVSAGRIDEIEATTRHDVIAFLTNLEESLGADSRFVHMGLTSSDVVDTALALAAPARPPTCCSPAWSASASVAAARSPSATGTR